MNIQRISAVFFKEWREIFRDRLFFVLAFIVPSALMLVFGYGINLDVEKLPFAVLDYDHSTMSRDYSYRFIGSRYFDFKGHVKDQQELDYLLSDSKVRMVLIIPEHFQKQLQQGQPTTAQILIDGTFPFRAATVKGYVILPYRLATVASSLAPGLGGPKCACRVPRTALPRSPASRSRPAMLHGTTASAAALCGPTV